ncbi:hypothetical protein Vretimale_19833, partial [Volvox reticuliferus]
MGPVRVRYTIPLGPHRAKYLARVVKIDLPWFRKHLTSTSRENLKLEGEVASLELVNAKLQLTAEVAIEAVKQQMEGLQLQLKEKEQELQELKAKTRAHVLWVEKDCGRKVVVLQQHILDITRDMEQEQEKCKKLDTDFQRLQDEVARERARDCTAAAEMAAVRRTLEAERVEMAAVRQQLQDAQDAAATAAAASSSLTSELLVKIQGLEGELCAATSEVKVLRQQKQEVEVTEPSTDAAHRKELWDMRQQVAELQEYVEASKMSFIRQCKETIAAQDEVAQVKGKLRALQAEVAQQRQQQQPR